MVAQIGNGIGAKLGTVLAACLPSAASNIIKICTVPSQCPTVMQCPYDGLIIRRKEMEKERIIQIVSMDIVQMNNVRSIGLDLFNQFLCRRSGVQAFFICQARECRMKVETGGRLDFVRVDAVGSLPPAVGDAALMPRFF